MFFFFFVVVFVVFFTQLSGEISPLPNWLPVKPVGGCSTAIQPAGVRLIRCIGHEGSQIKLG